MDTWMILAAIGVLLLLLIATIVALLVYSGAFETVEVGAGKPPIGKVVIAYKFARGPYKNVGPMFCEACSIAPKHKMLGIYYDDPKRVEAHRLRHAVGTILAEEGEEVDEDLKKKFESEGFKIMELPSVENVVRSAFPYSTALSIQMAVMKVYPKLSEYIEEHKLCAHPFLEIYIDNIMHFMVPLSKQDEFYVPEALQHFPGEEPYESIYSDDSTLQDISQSELDDSQSEPSLLDSPQVVRAAFLEKEEQAVKEPGDDRESGEEEPPAKGGVKGEQGSDEDSTSSFEELKMDGSNGGKAGSQ